MFKRLLSGKISSNTEKILKEFRPLVSKINDLEQEIQGLEQGMLASRMGEIRTQIDNGSSLDEQLAPVFALVREVSRRLNGERHFDVQLLGGMALHRGMIAEMKTGEGKTLASTAPACLNALSNRGVHLVTPNDYLARRDQQWMGDIYKALGLTVGLIQHGMDDISRQQAYQNDITYGTNNEYGFDYLRDNMKFRLTDYVQRELNYAIIDEVDSILVDEARTPLIISGASEESTDKYPQVNEIIRGLDREIRKEEVVNLPASERHGIPENWNKLEEDKAVVRPGEYTMDEKARSIHLSELGAHKLELKLKQKKLMPQGGLFDFENMDWLHHVNQALKAVYLFKRDVDYVVRSGQVVIVDEFTGRLMAGRRFGDGLHQAIEAKEKVKIERESQTYASVTFQNYFRMYKKRSGMTGTAKTEEEEFIRIYNMPVLVVPTNKPMVRQDQPDLVYKTNKAKQDALVNDIEVVYKTAQPILVGTISIEASEELSAMLKQRGVPHTVLNAKYHEQEASIVASAGEKNRVTIATNMAGRGTDIKLGKQVNQVGGLFIMGTERHESRRIDNQLRGRSGRQGDPGCSRFYLSLEDNLMRIFGGEKIANLMNRLHMPDDEAITHGMVSRAIENAQKKVEAHNFELRKHVLEYDDVMNRQREIIYARRRQILSPDVENTFLDMADELMEQLVLQHTEGISPSEWELQELSEEFLNIFGLTPKLDENALHDDQILRKSLVQQMETCYAEKRSQLDRLLTEISQSIPSDDKLKEISSDFLRHIMLSIHDHLWKDHLLSMDHLRDAIGLVGYAQKKPLDEYKREGFKIFENLMLRISEETVTACFRTQPSIRLPAKPKSPSKKLVYSEPSDTPTNFDPNLNPKLPDSESPGPIIAAKAQLTEGSATGTAPSQTSKLPNWGKKNKRRR